MSFQQNITNMILFGAADVKDGYNGNFLRVALMYNPDDMNVYVVHSSGYYQEHIISYKKFISDGKTFNEVLKQYSPELSDNPTILNYYFLNIEIYLKSREVLTFIMNNGIVDLTLYPEFENNTRIMDENKNGYYYGYHRIVDNEMYLNIWGTI